MARLLSILGVVTILLGGAQARAASTSPGDNAAFASVQAKPLAGGGGTTLATVKINTARAHRVLSVRVMMATNDTGNVEEILAFVTVNGSFVLEPISNVGTECEDVYACTLVGTFWVDIDTLDSQNGGGWIGQPLNVTLIGLGVYPTSPSTSQVNASIEARLESK